MRSQDLSYYARQSPITDPGRMSGWLADVPNDLSDMRRIARGLVIHYRAERPLEQGIAPQRLAEVDTRYADEMLARLAELDNRTLTATRQPTERLVGCCRDFTVLFLTMARAAGIPARSRVGFATYFVPGYSVDHVVAEVWDTAGQRWRLVDAELGDDHVGPDESARIDPLDVDRDKFLVAGAAWRLCRARKADAESFLVDPHLDIVQMRSWPYLRHNLVHDLAALNKVEMLLWDSWGMIEPESLGLGDIGLLDRLAKLTSFIDPDPSELRAFYTAEPELQVPVRVTSYEPLGGEPRQVLLR